MTHHTLTAGRHQRRRAGIIARADQQPSHGYDLVMALLQFLGITMAVYGLVAILMLKFLLT